MKPVHVSMPPRRYRVERNWGVLPEGYPLGFPSQVAVDMQAFELDVTLPTDVPGELLLEPARLRFAYATEFAEDLVQERRALDRNDVYVRAEELRLTVLPLPEAGRPPAYAGALGAFELGLEATPRELRVGDELQLVMRLRFPWGGPLGDTERHGDPVVKPAFVPSVHCMGVRHSSRLIDSPVSQRTSSNRSCGIQA